MIYMEQMPKIVFKNGQRIVNHEEGVLHMSIEEMKEHINTFFKE